mmetsp:Transcript_17864/g.12813  ORF Transcript_17864/g.12813 Transcript_17864/m.12813 type:complete len:84 (+) Transcript_17864:1113-1364(+)|eukprot:CAMPEP_0202977656 /NCGR_PEP_ID=MMETSP1396-20130829/84376_1 /ASSEMBLY_ACC=CAM_ASM_000872 /TAXON_ID= /ORGANISM="Pseudokeronopsis sp., Strain Brazil" /LENGTH=83 /DNA_ID=CAMNT_0049716443 /DNA_START=1435 /DNA_END=1686 /DNA_ORIENTATION=+
MKAAGAPYGFTEAPRNISIGMGKERLFGFQDEARNASKENLRTGKRILNSGVGAGNILTGNYGEDKISYNNDLLAEKQRILMQ